MNQSPLPSFAQRESKLEGATKTGAEAVTKKPRITKSPSNDDGSSDSEDSDSSEADGGLVLVQKEHPEGGGEHPEGTDPEEGAAVAELLQKAKKKEKKMRITSDGVAAAGVATKRVFDEDGGAVVSSALCSVFAPCPDVCLLCTNAMLLRVRAYDTRRGIGRTALLALHRPLSSDMTVEIVVLLLLCMYAR